MPAKTEYRFIKFVLIGGGLWACYNRKDMAMLAIAEYHRPWRKWIIEAKPHCVFSADCLSDMADFLTQLDKAPAPMIGRV